MNATHFVKLLSLTLIISLVVAQGLLLVPTKAHAVIPVEDIAVAVESGITAAQSILSVVEETLTEAGVYASYALEYLYYINTWVLQPLAFIQSGQAVQALTGAALAFVAGGTNGTGASQFVQNFPKHLQGAGDNAQQAFLRQLRAQPNSPYAGVIAASLQASYLQGSSLAGFFAANRNTLPQFSSDPTAFLAGDWSKGGVNAWFAVTTKSQNNPYALHQRAQSQLASLITIAEDTQRKTLDWGKGMLSWCGATEKPVAEGGACSFDGVTGTMTDGICMQNEATDVKEAPVDPGSPCSKKDGTPGEIKTPGSTITNYLDKSLGLNADKINSMGEAATQITSMVGALMQTIQLAQTVIGGPQGGLAGVGRVWPGQAQSLISSYTATSTGYAGASQCTINQQLATQAPSNGAQVEGRIPAYLAAWQTIGAAAATASTTVTSLRDVCLTNAQTVQAKIDAGSSSSIFIAYVSKASALAQQAQYALSRNSVDPYNPTDPNAILYVLNKARNASSTVAASLSTIEEVTTALESDGVGDPPVCQNITAQSQSLNDLTPTAADLAYAKQDTMKTTIASTTPKGSLALVSGEGSLVAKMNLLSTNATALLPQCALPLGI